MNEVRSTLSNVEQVDLSAIREKLAKRKGMSRTIALELEKEYKRFLTLAIAHPEDDLAISANVDPFWHEHILDTVSYAEFCNRFAGRFLHHTPTPLVPEADEKQLVEDSYLRTLALYEANFGAPRPAYWPAHAGVTNCFAPRDQVYFP